MRTLAIGVLVVIYTLNFLGGVWLIGRPRDPRTAGESTIGFVLLAAEMWAWFYLLGFFE